MSCRSSLAMSRLRSMVSVLFDLEAILDARADGATAEPNQRVCAADPTVQAIVAKLNTAMTTSMGILACMTTAWWGSVSRTTLLPVLRQLRTDVCALTAVGPLWPYENSGLRGGRRPDHGPLLPLDVLVLRIHPRRLLVLAHWSDLRRVLGWYAEPCTLVLHSSI